MNPQVNTNHIPSLTSNISALQLQPILPSTPLAHVEAFVPHGANIQHHPIYTKPHSTILPHQQITYVPGNNHHLQEQYFPIPNTQNDLNINISTTSTSTPNGAIFQTTITASIYGIQIQEFTFPTTDIHLVLQKVYDNLKDFL